MSATIESLSIDEVEEPPFSIEQLERIAAPSANEFLERYVRPSRPVVLTGVCRDWLPAEQWTLDRMATRWGATQVVAAALSGGSLLEEGHKGVVFEHIPLREFIESLGRPGPARHYVMAPTWNFPAALGEDYRVPRYCAGAPYLRAKVWVGKAGTVTPVHRDVPHNLHVHLTGRKRWLLFPPGDSARMYPRGLFSGMPNFANVDPEHPDYDRYPLFRDATAFGATLGPAETLFIPHGWWHHTRSLDDAVSMNFWWGGRLIYMVGLGSTIFKRVTGIRQNEWA
jgi:hypothetical protein